jgi:hypothetical protein
VLARSELEGENGMNLEEWKKENEFEKKYWGDCTNTSDEEAKQLEYAKYMGLDQYRIPGFLGGNFDLQGKSILDIGGGPVSLLLKCKNFSEAFVVDPCEFPDWIIKRYEKAGIQFRKMMAEDLDGKTEPFLLDLDQGPYFDEVWIYNVLQHCLDPERILNLAKKLGKVIRIFEWIDTQKDLGHPHVQTKEWFDRQLDVYGQTVQFTWAGTKTPLAYHAVVQTEEPEIRFRFHLLGLAHLPTRKEISACAYTQKVYKLATMLRSLGHYVIFYGVENSEIECDEYHQCLTDKERRACYGDYDWDKEFFKHDGKDAAYTTFAKRAIETINKIKQPKDILLVPMGNYQQSISQGTGVLTVESGIGYSGVFANYRVFESYSWMHYVYGLLRQSDGSWYDAVIPNYFDPNDFPLCTEKEDYFLYIGRVIKRKGVEVASQISKHLGKRLVIAGQGGLKSQTEGIDLTNEKHIDYIGTVGPEKRKEVMGKAILTFMPTYYIEPFGGVAVESMMCGTPVLTSDWGVFPETIQHGVTGFRCRTFDDFLWAARNIDKIDPVKCNSWAVSNYSMDRVKYMYHEYFKKIYDLHSQGWYQIHKNKTELDWLKRYY